MTKSELRIKYKALRNKLTTSDLESFNLLIANKVVNLDVWNHSYFHIFLAIVEKKEVDTDIILSILSGKDKHIILSKSDFETNSMMHFLLTDSTVIKINEWRIPEPVDGIEINTDKIEVVFIPLLAFDKLGNRVGYGKGFYDKFLAECKPETIKIGLSFFEAEDLIEDVNSNDVKLDFCITPKTTYRFNF